MLLRRARRVVANLIYATGMLGANLTEAESGKSLSDRPALDPNPPHGILGGRGNVGIIRSPVRASMLPDPLTSTGSEPALRATGTPMPGPGGDLSPSGARRRLRRDGEHKRRGITWAAEADKISDR
jgi:hypothetical protein